MSMVEFTVLGALLFGLVAANGLASQRAYRNFGYRSRPYLYLIWLIPVLGALFILANTPARPRSAYSTRHDHTLTAREHPTTLMLDP